jgi:hypothetical protein
VTERIYKRIILGAIMEQSAGLDVAGGGGGGGGGGFFFSGPVSHPKPTERGRTHFFLIHLF